MAMIEKTDVSISDHAYTDHERAGEAVVTQTVAMTKHAPQVVKTREQASTLAQTDSSSVMIDPLLCPVEVAARIIGQKWTLQIVKTLLNCKSQRFCELQEALGGVNPSTLSSRLKMLEDEGMIRRVQISAIPPHVEYSLTEMGCELRGVIQAISYWSRDWLCTPERLGSWDEINRDE